jgi:hypothetical protein
MDILKQINQEKQSFEDKHIQIVPNLLFNQKDTIEQIYFHYLSTFKDGEIDDEGDKKYFYNIVRNPCKVYSKSIDFDTKNVRLLTSASGDSLKTWFLEREFKFWMKDKQFGKVLNRVFLELPIFGSVVLKVIKGKIHFVDLRNFIVEQSADSLKTANYIIEKHPYTVMEFRKVAKEMGWKKAKVDEAIKLFRQMKDIRHIMVYERYGEVEVSQGNWEYRRVYLADVGVSEEDEQTANNPPYKGVELDSDKVTEIPYWEYHLEKIPGRWLGIGVVETLYEPQVRENELANVESKATYWRGWVGFQSPDPGVAGKNLATEVPFGAVLDSSEGNTTQIDVSDRNLGYFGEQTEKWMRIRSELVLNYDAVQGKRPPASTPLGQTQINLSQTLSYFEQVQETIAMDIKEMIYKVILPQFEKDTTQEHTLRIIGRDLDAFIAMIRDTLVLEEIVKQFAKGNIPTNYDAKVIGIVIENGLKKNGELLKDIPKNFYKGLKYDIDIDITGESVDTRVKSATKFAILQAITADPTMTQDPMKKKLLYSMAEDGGINLNDFIGQEQQTTEEQVTEVQGQKKGAGGGVSAPKMSQAPVPGQFEKTI